MESQRKRWFDSIFASDFKFQIFERPASGRPQAGLGPASAQSWLKVKIRIFQQMWVRTLVAIMIIWCDASRYSELTNPDVERRELFSRSGYLTLKGRCRNHITSSFSKMVSPSHLILTEHVTISLLPIKFWLLSSSPFSFLTKSKNEDFLLIKPTHKRSYVTT